MTSAVAVGSMLLGPVAALIYESGGLRVFTDLTNDLWLVVAIALCGVAVGTLSVFRRQRFLGVLSVVCNLAVATLYGFIGAFFALGGSR